MDASLAATVGDGAANLTAALHRLDLLNASSSPTRWDSSPPAGGIGLDEQPRFIQEQAYRDFTTTIQVLILISSLLGESPHVNKHIMHDYKASVRIYNPAEFWKTRK